MSTEFEYVSPMKGKTIRQLKLIGTYQSMYVICDNDLTKPSKDRYGINIQSLNVTDYSSSFKLTLE